MKAIGAAGLAFSALISFSLLAQPVDAIPPGPVVPLADDLWQAARAQVTATTPLFEGFLPGPIFGGVAQSLEPESTVFGDRQPPNFTHSIEWQTAEPLLIDEVRVFAAGDLYFGHQIREFERVVIKAKTEGSPDFDQVLLDFRPSHPYSFINSGSHFLRAATFAPIRAKSFRAEFEQHETDFEFSTGPRIIELDALGPAPVITAEPQNAVAALGEVAQFIATVAGYNPTYQWFRNGTLLPGETNATLTFPVATRDLAGEYQAVVRSGGRSISSRIATLSIEESLSFSPSSTDLWDVSQGTRVLASSPAIFPVSNMLGDNASSGEPGTGIFADNFGAGAIHFLEWETPSPVTVRRVHLFAAGTHWPPDHVRAFAKMTIRAQSAGSLTYDHIVAEFTPGIPFEFLGPEGLILAVDVPAVTAQRFRVEFTENTNAVFGSLGPRIVEIDAFGAHLPVVPPAIIAEPQDLAVQEGRHARFQVEATGTNIRFAWRKNDSFIAGATNSLLLLPHVSPADQGIYSVDVIGGGTLVRSRTARLTVTTPPALAQSTADLWDIHQGTKIIRSSPMIFPAVDMFGADSPTPETGTAIFADNTGTGAMHFVEWETARSVTVEKINLFASGTHWPPDYVRSLSKVIIRAKAPGSIDYNVKLLDFSPELPYEFFDPRTGAILSTNISSVTAREFRAEFFENTNEVFGSMGPRIMELDAFGVVQQPSGTTIADWPFEGGAAGAPAAQVPDESGNGHTLSAIDGMQPVFVETQPPADGGVSVSFPAVSGGIGSGLRAQDHPDLNPAGAFTIEVSVNPGRANTNFNRGIVVGQDAASGRLAYALDYRSETRKIDFLIADTSGRMDVVNTEVPDDGRSHHVAGVYGNGSLAIYLDRVLVSSTNSSVTLGIAPGANGRLTIGANDIGGFWFEGIIDRVRFSRVALSPSEFFGGGPINGRPRILTQPASQTVPLGSSATFRVDVLSAGPTTYQWLFGNLAIPGATSAVYRIPEVNLAHAGTYRVFVANPFGNVISDPAELMLPSDLEPPIVEISSPQSGVVFEDRISISGAARDNVAVTRLQLQRDGIFVADLPFADGKFAITNVTLLRGTNSFRVTASDAVGNQAEASVTLFLAASRTLFIPSIPPVQEGSKAVIPILLTSPGDVGAITLSLNYDPAYLAEPAVKWPSALDGWTQVNTSRLGEVRLVFALPGIPLASGTQEVASVEFRARSVPGSADTALNLRSVDFYSPQGQPINVGSDVISGSLRLTQRRFPGDNNANDRLDVGDASVIMRLAAGLDQLRPWDVTGNDLNANSMLDAGDAIRVLRAAVNLDPQPPGASTPLRAFSRAEAAAAVRLVADQSRLIPGTRVTVRALLDDVQLPVAGASFKLEFPADALRLENGLSHRVGSLVSSSALAFWNVSPAQTDYSQQDGSLYGAFSSADEWSGSEGELAVFTFTVLDSATNQVNWPVRVSRAEFADRMEVHPLSGAEISFKGGAPSSAILRPVQLDRPNGVLLLRVLGENGAIYRVETSENLLSWTPLGTYGPVQGDFTVPVNWSEGARARYYRALQAD